METVRATFCECWYSDGSTWNVHDGWTWPAFTRLCSLIVRKASFCNGIRWYMYIETQRNTALLLKQNSAKANDLNQLANVSSPSLHLRSNCTSSNTCQVKECYTACRIPCRLPPSVSERVWNLQPHNDPLPKTPPTRYNSSLYLAD